MDTTQKTKVRIGSNNKRITQGAEFTGGLSAVSTAGTRRGADGWFHPGNWVLEMNQALALTPRASVGLDAGIGLLHVDTPNRDSQACDLMEPIRPETWANQM